MSLELAAAIVALVAGVVLFIRGVMLVRGRLEPLQGHLMMWGGILILMAAGFLTNATIGETSISFIMILGGFALLGQALTETVRARRDRGRRGMRR